LKIQQFAKPKIKKHRPKNNPKPTADDICMITGKIFAETHEIFYGPNRQLSIRYGLQVKLSQEYHTGPKGPHHNREFDLELKRIGQAKFEQSHSRAEFMEIFKVGSYL
jgi:hypothetical protein